MNKKVALSVLSATVFASMAASAFAAPKSGLYIGGEVDKFYSFDTLFDATEGTMTQFTNEIGSAGFSNLIYVDFDGKGASLQEIMDSTDFNSVKKDLTADKFEGVYANIKADGSADGTYDPRNDVDPVPTGDLKVESVSAINLNTIQVKFSQEVDSTSAQDETLYLLDGVALSNANDVATLQSDKKTVVITLDAPLSQYEKRTLTVKGPIYSADKLKTVPAFDQEISFSDVTVPTVKSVTASGNKSITVAFSEPVAMDVATLLPGSTFKIDGQALTTLGFSNAVVNAATNVNNFASSITLNFATALPAGAHKLTVPAGTATDLIDAANFKLVQTDVNFTVEGVADAPKITEVTGENNGTVYVTFDRAMDTSAETEALYTIDGTPANSADFVAGSDKKKVKLVFTSVAKGTNVLVVDAENIEDSFGNALADDELRLSFNAGEDTVKPTVTNVTLLNSTTVRVKFSEVVDNVYAGNKANYVLKNASGTTISNANYSVAAVGATPSDTYDITMSAGNELTGANYSLAIKNVQDLAGTPNVMDAYTTTFSGNDTVEPAIDEVLQLPGNKVAVFFSEAMDEASIKNKANYAYVDGATPGVVHQLPAGATVAAADGNTSAIITFPSSYVVLGTTNDEFEVAQIRVSNVKDKAGNVLAGIVDTETIVGTGSGTLNPALVVGSFNLKAEGTKVIAEFELDQAITNLDKADFLVETLEADSAYVSGNKVVLTYTTPAKVATIKAAGAAAELTSIASPTSTNAYGTTVAQITGETVNDDAIKPVITAVAAASGTQSVTITFSENVDDTIAGLYKDDFTFVLDGTTVTPDSVAVSGDDVVFTFAASTIAPGDVVTVKAKTTSDIKDLEDAAGDQNLYVPSTTDKAGRDATAS